MRKDVGRSENLQGYIILLSYIQQNELIYGSKFTGNFGIGGQYHFTMEAQTTFCFPNDDGGLNLFCASHWLDITVKTASLQSHNKYT